MHLPRRLDLSHDALDLVLALDQGLRVERWTVPSAHPWVELSSPLFAVTTAGRVLDASTPGAEVRAAWVDRSTPGRVSAAVTIEFAADGLEVDLHIVVYPGTALLEQWVTVRNAGTQPVHIDQLDSIALHLPRGRYQLLSFASGWGAEFEGVCVPLGDAILLESQSGRSSNGMHPFCVLSRGDEMLAAAVAWSGNWAIRFQPDEAGYSMSGGLSAWEFFIDLAPGRQIAAPRAVLALATGDLDDVSRQYHRVGRRHWYPRNETSRRLPLEWNHWWSYEDRDIDEQTFRANVDFAARIGIELCTLDAGWFGPSDANAAWKDFRGDWDRVNAARFPAGIRGLSDYTHSRGLLFGLWCEIEGLGAHAAVAGRHPEFAALRDGVPLGYVCFGCPDVQEWALSTLERLAVEYGCDWIKLDFNVDPGAGCNRSDHGHGPGDGLYAHYRGYDTVLSRFHVRHPEIVLESCSSGGLRIDLGIMRRTHVTFLSDPDWPEHNLQVFWGATMMLAPEVCLHWGPSEWITPHPHQTFDPRAPGLTRQRLDYHMRTALLGAAGFSLRLPELPAWVADRIALHAQLYKEHIRRFVRDGELSRLTGQPRRDGQGDRWCAFQYSLPGEHLVFIFRLPGAGPERIVRLRALKPDVSYRITMLDDEMERRCHGRELMQEGVRVDWLNEEESAIMFVHEESGDR